MGDGPPAPKGGRRLGQGRQASRVWRRGREAGPEGGLAPMFISLRSPRGPRNISVCFASNSCLTTAFLKMKRKKKKKKARVLKIQALALAFVNCPCQSPFVRGCALQAVTSHSSAPMAPPLSHNNLHSR